ncbi:oxidoreductase [Shimia sp. R11_0]|uniref:molybdopterin-dependent oxidoreductase n=1 Tax=Shimia sp. R11_0 TaxID=2821096 RepID=UPI001ADA98E2|nr:molybdopterin-dependent oxidoreductase [Shimia sp. R11_0]MBO9476733.1 oxidoreductase [Shimia sp. R11_0]
MFQVKKFVIALVFAVGLPTLASAEDTLLTVSGEVAATEQGQAWSFTVEDLREMPKTTFETETIWTDGVQVFEGVSLDVLLDHVGAQGETIRATAANDYAITIPSGDAVSGGPIVAYLRNGQEMSLRDKGPLWIVYPFDDNVIYKSEEYYSRSIWQLNRIEVVAGE